MSETLKGLDAISSANHDIECLASFTKLASSYAAGGGEWSGVQISEFGAAMVWAAFEIDERTDIISRAHDVIDAARPEVPR